VLVQWCPRRADRSTRGQLVAGRSTSHAPLSHAVPRLPISRYLFRATSR